jgi:toxin-antitoxin system PIN domain toxin
MLGQGGRAVLTQIKLRDRPESDLMRALLLDPYVGLAWATILGFVRITTNHRILARPLAVADVMERVQVWLALPHFHIAQPSDRHFPRLRTQLERLGTAANLTTAAHLAVLAMERGYVLYSTDTDFARFEGLRWINPCRT